MILAEIDKEYVTVDLNLPTRVGTTWDSDKFPEVKVSEEDKVRFRVKDDDGEVYYRGWLLNDVDALVQISVLAFCLHDAGATTIEVKINGKWIQEIG